jgi:outer membrane biosynthesis protein TonB
MMKYTPLICLLTAFFISTTATLAQAGTGNDRPKQTQPQATELDKASAPQNREPASTPNLHPSKPIANPTPQTTPGGAALDLPRKSTPEPNSPSARYRKLVMDAIGARWHAYVQPQQSSLAFGTARVTFHIDTRGHVTDIKLESNTSDKTFGNICVRSVEEALLPALTKDVLAAAKNKPLEYSINFTLYELPSKSE